GATTVDCSPPSGNLLQLKLTTVASNINRPVLAKAAPGDSTRLYVVGQDGKIWLVKNGTQLATPFLDISAVVHQPGGGDERGLLGLAFHPDYAKNGRFFVYYTDTNTQNGSTGDQNVVEFARSANPDKADANPKQTLFVQPDTESNHNGGSMEFSP